MAPLETGDSAPLRLGKSVRMVPLETGACNKATNGLEQDWNGHLIWCNPPYSQKNEFIEKAHGEAQAGKKLLCLCQPLLKQIGLGI